MQKKILICNNLIGDSLYLLRPIEAYLERFPEECIGLIVLPQLGGDIIKAHFKARLPIYGTEQEALEHNPGAAFLAMNAGRAMQIAFEHHSKTKKTIHISEAFGAMLGVNVKDIKPPLDWLKKFPTGNDKIALIAPFSASCARHSGKVPNKTLDDFKWEHIIRYLRRHEYIVQCMAGPKDLLNLVTLPISSYRTATSLDSMSEIIHQADLVISVDNGIAHMASACGVRTIVLFPEMTVPQQFIAPLWSKTTSYIMVGNPNKVQPAALLYGLKEMLAKA